MRGSEEWYFLDLHCTNNGFLVPKKNSEVVSEGEDIFLCVSMIVLGGELASEVSRRRTELASKPPKTLMANTENDI